MCPSKHPKMYGTRKVYCPDVKSTPQEKTIVTFSCSTCLEQFPTKEEMIEHSYANHPSNKLTFRCGNCEEGFESTDEVLQHMKDKHPTVVQFTSDGFYLYCPICKAGVNSKDEMAEHLRTHDTVNQIYEEPSEREVYELPVDGGDTEENCVFRCSECGVQMASKVEVVRHMHEAHAKRQLPREDNAESEGKILRLTDPVSGKGHTRVEKDDGKTYVFDDEETAKYIKLEEGGKKEYMSNLCMLGMRGLVTELGQRLMDESQLFRQRRQERELLVQNSAFLFFGLDDGASKKDVQDAYKKKARQLHPDKNGGTDEANTKFQRMK